MKISSWEKIATIAAAVSAVIAVLAFLRLNVGSEQVGDVLPASLVEDENAMQAERRAALRLQHRPVLEDFFSDDEDASKNARDTLIASGEVGDETFMELARIMLVNPSSAHGLRNSLDVFVHYIDKTPALLAGARELLCLEAVFIIHPDVDPGLSVVCPRLGDPAFSRLREERRKAKKPPEEKLQAPIQLAEKVDTAPRKVYSPAVEYTENARRARIQGTVIVQAIIDEQGQVREVKTLKGLPLGLSEQAEKTIKRWRFEPASFQGNPVAVYYNLSVNFRLVDPPDAEEVKE